MGIEKEGPGQDFEYTPEQVQMLGERSTALYPVHVAATERDEQQPEEQ